MTCEICGRCSCTRSFHPLEVQEHFDKYSGMSTRELIEECMDKDNEIADLKKKINEIKNGQED